jgi:hypothetical protein
MNLAPAAKDQAQLLLDVAKATENFRDQLTKAGVPLKTVNDLTDQYTTNLKKVKLAELDLKNLVSPFQAMEKVFSQGLDQATQQFVDNLVEGKNAFYDFGMVGKAVLKDLLNTMLQLSFMNPLKNALFGTNYQTLGGNTGIGGLLGGLFGGGSSSVQFQAPTSFGIGHMAKGGRTYGRAAGGPQFIEMNEGYLPEAFVPLPDGRSIPVTMNGDSGGTNVQVIVQNMAPNTQVTERRHKGPDGERVIVGIVQKANARGDLDASQQGRYGVHPQKVY